MVFDQLLNSGESITVRPFMLLIAPVRADPDFARKMCIVQDLCSKIGFGYRLPSVDFAQFDIAAELSLIQGADRIIADLSYGRPSCYYELGLVEASRREVNLIARAGTEIFQNAEKSPVAFFDDLEGYAALVSELLDG